MINMVSRRPTGEVGGKDENGADKAGRVWLSTDRKGVLSENLKWRFVTKAERSNDLGAFEPGSGVRLAPSMTYTFADGTKLTLGATYTHIGQDHAGGARLRYNGSVVVAPFGKIDRDLNAGQPAYDWYKRDQLTLPAEVIHEFDTGWTLTNNTRIGASDVDESPV